MAPKDELTPELKEEIRKLLAKEKAREKLQTIFSGLEDQMSEAERTGTFLDFAALAKENGIESGKTKPMSNVEALNYDIGKSLIGGQRFVDYGFKQVLWKPVQSWDEKQQTSYLFWIVRESADRIPKFSDKGVRAEVLARWKLDHARQAALAAAEKLAVEARRSGKTLKRLFADRPDIRVTETEPFSWMTFGPVPVNASYQPPKLSEVEGVDRPGPAFMRTVFELTKGEAGVAMNEPQTVAYVIRVIGFDPPDDALMTWFKHDSLDLYLGVAQDDHEARLRAWQKEFREQAGLKWEPRPKQPSKEPAPPEEPDTDAESPL